VAKEYGYHSLVVEGDCLALIQKLQHQVIDDNVLGFIVSDILHIAKTFSFISFIKREGNKLAHDLAHWLPLSSEDRLWVNDVPNHILS